MRIGIDFDNTIVNYDGIFYKAGVELGWLSADSGHSKQDVKSYFIDKGIEPKWTELQGIVYGKAIADAVPYQGVQKVLNLWFKQGHQLFLVSHKTRYPIIGEKLDFHAAAKDWLQKNNLSVFFNKLFFCEEKQIKVDRITLLKLDLFIDDLPNVLLHKDFPESTKRYLFGFNQHIDSRLLCVPNWGHLEQL